tara:strand:+ start:43 stop:432 length:390 start_codon:yes stop_codon:yes gene_type:complete
MAKSPYNPKRGFPGPLGSAKDDPYTFNMPRRELQARIQSHKSLYGKARKRQETMLQATIDQTNPFKRLAGAHRTLKAAYKNRKLGENLYKMQSLEHKRRAIGSYNVAKMKAMARPSAFELQKIKKKRKK